MRKLLTVGIVVLLAGGAAAYYSVTRRGETSAAANGSDGGQGQGAPQQGQPGPGQRGQQQRGGMGGGFGGPGGGFRPPMAVEVTKVTRGTVAAQLNVVGNLVGESTVDVAPKTGGRLVAVPVKLGDRVRRGQLIGKIEDREIVEQVRQAQASHEVAQATIRQREADLNLAETNVERSRNLFARQLLPKQTLDDAEARYQAAVAQLDLSRAQLAQSDARREELRINLANTNIVSPVDGFIAKRLVDPGAWVSQNAPVVSVVDISRLRLIANVVEKDLRAINPGDPASVEVDAFPGEKFTGRVARVAPVLDPATRTASMEIEIPNREFRLKPGMYARVDLVIDNRENVLVVPKIALVDVEGQRGVYQPSEDNKAKFRAVKVGLENTERAEIVEGLSEGEIIVSSGASALRRDDQLTIAGQPGGAPGGGRGPGRPGRPGGPGAPDGSGQSGGQGTPGGQFNRGNQAQPGASPGTTPQQNPGGQDQGQRRFNPGQRPEGGDSPMPGGQRRPGQRPPQSMSVQQQRPIA